MGRDDTRIQYLQDATGRTTAVLVPIELWEQMEQKDDTAMPEWHKAEIDRIQAQTKPEDYQPLEQFLKEWESD
jgi:hypothetical protein